MNPLEQAVEILQKARDECRSPSCGMCRATDTVLSALTSRGAGEGRKLVPVEPTREMWAASGDAVNKFGHRLKRHHDRYSEAVWTAMLAASPEHSK